MISLVLWILLPALLYAGLLYAHDLHEREPLAALVAVFVAGVLSVPLASELEQQVDQLAPFLAGMRRGDGPALLWACFGVIAPIEEGLKLALVVVLARRRLMNEPVDGVVYAGMVALGFAAGEGFIAALQHGHATLPMRALFSMPGHVGFSAMWGAGLGALRYWGRPALGPFALMLVASIAAHGGYDYLLLVDGGSERGAVVALLSLVFVLDALCFRALLRVSPFRGLSRTAGQCSVCLRPHGPLLRFCAGCGAALGLRAPSVLPIAFAPTVSAFVASFVLGGSLLALSARYHDLHYVALSQRAALGADDALWTLSGVLLVTSAFCGFVAGAFRGRRALLEATVAGCLVLLSGFLWLALRAPGALPRLLPAALPGLALSALVAAWVRRTQHEIHT